MECIFCKIVKGEIPSFKVWEDEKHLAFLTIRPTREGHTLVIPKVHSEYLFEMDDNDLSILSLVSKKVAKILVEVLFPNSGKVGLVVAGLEVPHTHIHLIPMDSEQDLSFSRAKDASSEELQKVLDKIKSFVE